MQDDGDDEEADDGCGLGYCKPPVSSRFPNQRNQNRGGRPRGVQNRKTIVRRVALERGMVSIGGKRQRLTQMELVLRIVAGEAARGNRKATRLTRKLLGILPLDEPQVPRGVFIIPERLSAEEWVEKYSPSADVADPED